MISGLAPYEFSKCGINHTPNILLQKKNCVYGEASSADAVIKFLFVSAEADSRYTRDISLMT
jgi:hypothetical protein